MKISLRAKKLTGGRQGLRQPYDKDRWPHTKPTDYPQTNQREQRDGKVNPSVGQSPNTPGMILFLGCLKSEEGIYRIRESKTGNCTVKKSKGIAYEAYDMATTVGSRFYTNPFPSHLVAVRATGNLPPRGTQQFETQTR